MDVFNRAEIVDNNFLDAIRDNFSTYITKTSFSSLDMSSKEIISIFESQVKSRHMDLKSRQLKNQGKCFYTIGSAGHEGNAVFGKVFPYTDMAFLHYRSSAFFIERSSQINGTTPIYDMALSFMASSDDPISGGRHKVIGSKILNIPPQTSTIASHIPKSVGAAFSIDRARDLNFKNNKLKEDSLIICSFGDASINHASALTGINTARWIKKTGGNVPIVFICEDNGTGISVPTPNNWIEETIRYLPGLKYIKCNGLDLIDLVQKSKQAEQYCRKHRSPVFLHMKTVRLLGHAGSDIELGYKKLEDIEKNEKDDPLLYSAALMLNSNFLNKNDILDIYEKSRDQINFVFEKATLRPTLRSANEVMSYIYPKIKTIKLPKKLQEEDREKLFQKDYSRLNRKNNMSKMINYALNDIMLKYNNTLIFGEDVGKKGGVYNITQNLQKKFGLRRVFDSPLDETSILGFALGLAHNGFLPIPEVQFLAYVHNAEDQIRSEAATLSFFSKSQYLNPFVLRLPGLAYQKGFGGHFHNDNSLSVFRDIPGINLACPSNGMDAVKILRASIEKAYSNGEITIVIEPIALYMKRDLHVEKDDKWAFKYSEISGRLGIGEMVSYGDSNFLAIISYGNGIYLSMQAKPEIEKTIKKQIKIIDLCWLSNIDILQLKNLIGDCKYILIVDECRKTGSIGESIVSNLYESNDFKGKIKLHAAKDSFIPIGKSATSTLPTKETIVINALNIINDK